MPLKLTPVDYYPLHGEVELEVSDERRLAEHVAYLVLGNHLHIQSILASKNKSKPRTNDKAIKLAITKLKYKTNVERYKRDGWIFQMITWIAVNMENIGTNFFSQVPHNAPSQHGLDGVAVLLKKDQNLEQIIISEDKYTTSPRGKLTSQVWPEFEEFENGSFDDRLVSIITMLLRHLDQEQLLESVNEDIYRPEIRKYRVGITPSDDNDKFLKRPKLFEDYDICVKGANHVRRNALTFYKPKIRDWMDSFCIKVIAFLETLKSTHV